MIKADKLHEKSIIFDATCPLATVGKWYESWLRGGVTAIAPTIGYPMSDTIDAIKRASDYLNKIAADPRLVLIEDVDQFFEVKESKKLGIVFHFQTSVPFEKELRYVRMFHKLGVRVVQLAYNEKNFVGDGCEERTDSGLSKFGVKLIQEFNKVGIVVDLSHTGYRTTMEAMEVSKHPVIFSHSNPKGIYDCVRNISDEQIKAVGKLGGVIGINGTPYFVSNKKEPAMQDFINHVNYVINLVGVDHVGLGLDFYEGMSGVATDEQAQVLYDNFVSSGVWDPNTYSPPPWYFPKGIRKPEQMPNLTEALVKEGYSENDIQKILGINFLRVFKEVWK